MNPSELAKAALLGESPREVVAPFRIGKHVDDPYQSPFLSWIEASLGADKHPSRFVIYDNPNVKMGHGKTEGKFNFFYLNL